MRRLCIFILSCLPGSLAAHELWLQPEVYVVAEDGMVRADIVNGERFEGPRFAYIPQRFERFVLADRSGIVPVTGRVGDLPALQMPAPAPGLLIAGYQSAPLTVRYDDLAAFERFAAHKDLGDAAQVHAGRGLPEAGFVEVYTRFSKSLVAVGDGAGADRALGFETEIVALANPYVDDLDALPVRLTYRDAPRADAQIEVFERTADGTVTVTTQRTDAEGVARIPLTPGTEVMLDAVVLREPAADLAEETGAVWETLWANLTFAVPD